jgi:2-oxoglutarate ferredoxin oxidoreductase subunit alpha
VAAWYPITPSTSLVNGYEKYAKRLRVDPETGLNKFAIVQAEDELAAIGMVIGASWNGARAFTSTSGPGISLMSELFRFGLFCRNTGGSIYDVQRTGPSTGMPTRTQQSDVTFMRLRFPWRYQTGFIISKYAKRMLSTLSADAFDLAERLQTPVIVMLDLDLGMNDHLTEPLNWDDTRVFDRGKVLDHEDLENGVNFGRYLDVEGDGISYRTIPGTHPTRGSYFTRGTSRDEYARYTEDGAEYVKNMEKLKRKWDTAKTLVPKPTVFQSQPLSEYGIIFFGTTLYPALEAMDILKEEGIQLNAMQIKAFPFTSEVEKFYK